MKKLLYALAISFFLTMASTATAAVQEFGPDYSRFTLDVPAGWTAKNIEGGVQVSNASEDTSVAVVVAKTDNKDARNLAEMLAKESGYDKPSFEKQDENTWLITGKVDGTKIATIVGLEDGKIFVITMAGKDMDTVTKIVDSLDDKK